MVEKEEHLEQKEEKKQGKVVEETKEEKKPEEKKEEEKTEKTDKKEKKKKPEKKKKEFAFVNAKDLPISTKQAVAVCNMIRGKKAGEAIILLEKVLKKQLAVPMRGEIPHRKRSHRVGKTLSGRYPEKASRIFIKILRNLIANANINGLDAEEIIITKIKADKASRPIKPTRIAYGRKRFKRTHVLVIAKEQKTKQEEKKEEQKKEKETKKEPEKIKPANVEGKIKK